MSHSDDSVQHADLGINSTYIYFGEDVAATRVDLPVYVGSVPTPHLDTFHEKLQACFNRIVQEGIDMKRMAMVIDRDERQVGPPCLPQVRGD